MKKLLLLFFFLAHVTLAFTQSLTATADTHAILLGAPFHVRLKGTFPQGRESWILVDTLSHFEVLDRSAIDTEKNYLGTTLTQELTLTSWDSGRWQLPPFVAGKARSAPLTISVNFTQPFDPNQPYNDIKDIIEVKKPEASSWHWYLIFGLILVLLFLLFFPKEKKKPKAQFVPDLNAYQQSLQELDRLRGQTLPADELHSSLLFILRNYLQRRKNIRSYSRTTGDLGVQLSALSLPRPALNDLLQALRLGDVVRFGRFSPGAEENLKALEAVREGIVQLEGGGHAV